MVPNLEARLLIIWSSSGFVNGRKEAAELDAIPFATLGWYRLHTLGTKLNALGLTNTPINYSMV